MKWKFWKRSKALKSDWGRFGISPESVNMFIAKNDATERNVPLQIVRGLADELVAEMVTAKDTDAGSMAERQGALKAYAKVALKLTEFSEESEKWIKAGGAPEGGEDA